MALDQLRELQSLASSALSEPAAVILSYRSELSRMDRAETSLRLMGNTQMASWAF